VRAVVYVVYLFNTAVFIVIVLCVCEWLFVCVCVCVCADCWSVYVCSLRMCMRVVSAKPINNSATASRERPL